jgi:F0F1-type ATP synthase membrane subunit b/b'
MRIDYDKDQLAYALANALKERDEAREKAERYRREANKFMLQCDESQEKYATEATEHMLAVNKICNERDEARENLDEEMKFHHRTHRELIETQCKLLDMDLKREETLDEIKRLKVILDLIKKDVS